MMIPQGRNKSTSSDDCQSAIDFSPKRNPKLQVSKLFDYRQEATLSDLSVEQLIDLVSSLKHTLGSAKSENYENILHDECIDGSCFSQLGHDELADIGFDPDLKTLCQQRLRAPHSSMHYNHPPTTDKVNPLMEKLISTSPRSNLTAKATFSPLAGTKAPPTFSTHSYGQLVVLGYREYRLSNEQVIYPVGSPNDVFPLRKQPESTGMKISCTNVHLRPENDTHGGGQGQESKYIESISAAQLGFGPNETISAPAIPNSAYRMIIETSTEAVRQIQTGRSRLRTATGETLLPYKVEVEFSMDSSFDMFQVGRHDGPLSVATSSSSSSSHFASPRRVNDIVVKGLVLSGQGSGKGGARGYKAGVSRVACRLLIERSTGRTFLFAGGFNASKTLALTATAPQWVYHKATNSADTPAAGTTRRQHVGVCCKRSSRRSPPLPRSTLTSTLCHRLLKCQNIDSRSSNSNDYEFDALTRQGIKVFFPAVGEWREISVMGRVYTLREEGSVCGVLTTESNELIDGCIIDIGGGVCLTYTTPPLDQQLAQSPHQQQCPVPHDDLSSSMMDVETPECAITSTATNHQDPNHFLNRLNDSKPVCPVLMNNLHFPLHLPAQRQALARLQSLRAAGQDRGFVVCQHSSTSSSPGHRLLLPHSTTTLLADGIEHDQQPYVFPACGHCFGFNPAFSGKACPLCRQEGPYVPLIFPFAKQICADQPTHVFHPCGHAASLQIPMPDSASLHEYLFPHQQSRRGWGQAAVGGGGMRVPIRRQRSAGESSNDNRARGVVMGAADASSTAASVSSAMAVQFASLYLPQHPACPFCSTKLELTAAGAGTETGRGQRFSKLVLQFEDGDVTLADI